MVFFQEPSSGLTLFFLVMVVPSLRWGGLWDQKVKEMVMSFFLKGSWHQRPERRLFPQPTPSSVSLSLSVCDWGEARS